MSGQISPDGRYVSWLAPRDGVLVRRLGSRAAREVSARTLRRRIATVRKAGVSDDELGIGALLDQFTQSMGTEPRPWVWGYRVRLGFK